MTTVDLRAPQVNVDLQHGDPFTLNVVSADTVPTTLAVWIALRQSAGTALVTLARTAITGGQSYELSEEDSLALSPSKAYQLVAKDSATGITWFTGPVKPSTEGAPGPTSQTVTLALSEAEVTVELTVASGVGGGGSGDVVGPASVTADRPAVFDGTTGKLLKQGSATGAALVAAADAAAARTALGLGTAATSASGDFAAASHTHTPASLGAQRVSDTPAVVANGGTIPAGATLALLQGATATLPAASSHGLGQEVTLLCIGGVDCVLSATGGDLLAAGAGITVDSDYASTLAAKDISAIATPGAISWFVTSNALDAADVINFVTSGGFATTASMQAADTVVGNTAELGDQRQAFADELAAEITRVFRGNSLGTGRWSTPNLTTEFTTGISYRCLRIPRRPASVPFFAEYFTQPHDTGAGSWDNIEGADLWTDDSFANSAGTPVGSPTTPGGLRDFHEQTEDGGTEDGSGWWPDLLMAADQAIETMTDITFGTGVGRKWLRVPYELDDGGTYHTDADDGAIFRLMSTFTSEKFESIDQHTEDWWLGNNYSGDIVRLIVRDGLDGTLIADPDASLVTPGATSFVDGAGNTWTGGAAAEVVDLTAATVDVVSNVATARILGRVTSGSGDSEELTAAQVRTLLGNPVVGGQDEGPAVTATSAATLLDAPISLTGEAGDHFTVSVGGSWLNNSGTTKTFTLTVLIGSTTVATLAPVSAIASSASLRYWRAVVDIRVNGASDVNVIADGQVGTSFFPVSSGSATENIGAGVNLDVRGAVQSGGSQELQITQITVARARA